MGSKLQLGDHALYYYKKGESCSTCILKAGCDIYNFNIPSDIYTMCCGFNNGFGIGCMCSVIVSGILLLGITFNDENLVKKKRLMFLNKLQEELGSINCCQLKNDCCKTIRTAGNILADIIEK